MKSEFQQLLDENGGVLRTADVVSAGIPKESFYRFAKEAGLEKVAHGIYSDPNRMIDVFYLTQMQFPMAIFSHETASYLHDLAEMEPMPLTVTVDRKYNSSALIKTGARICYVKREWYSLGASTVMSPSGFPITVYDMERTICDIIRKRRSMDVSTFNYALREYVKRKDRNLERLSDYAKELHMEKQFWVTMGVLL